jgi:uronate dehydrogenase
VSEPQRIVLTGSAGSIGRCIAPALRERGHDVRGFDRVESPDLDGAVVADLTDRAALDRAMADRETLIHLAACPRGNGRFIEDIVQPNIIGLHHTFDAARQAGVRRIIFASTMQSLLGFDALDCRPADDPITVGHGTRPINHYALSKVWAEQYGQMLSRLDEITFLAVRIGWFVPVARSMAYMRKVNAQRWFLSHDDAKRFFIAAVEAPDPEPRFAILFATGPEGFVDLEPARRLIGYDPQDAFPRGCPFSIG